MCGASLLLRSCKEEERKNSIFILCVCVRVFEYDSFAIAHQRFSFSFYVI